jgi:hypothetical protein
MLLCWWIDHLGGATKAKLKWTMLVLPISKSKRDNCTYKNDVFTYKRDQSPWERNKIKDGLFRDGLTLEQGTWIVFTLQDKYTTAKDELGLEQRTCIVSTLF